MKHRFDQKFRVPSPFRPQTTMAMEKLNMAAKDAQPRVNNMRLTTSLSGSYLGFSTFSSARRHLS